MLRSGVTTVSTVFQDDRRRQPKALVIAGGTKTSGPASSRSGRAESSSEEPDIAGHLAGGTAARSLEIGSWSCTFVSAWGESKTTCENDTKPVFCFAAS